MPLTPHHERKCSIILDSLKVNCLDFSLAILYAIFACALGVWALMLRQRQKTVNSSRTKPLLMERSPNEGHSAEEHEYSSTRVQGILLLSLIWSNLANSFLVVASAQGMEEAGSQRPILQACQNCGNEVEREITTSYMDSSGALRLFTVQSKDLSSSWTWESSSDGSHEMKGDDMIRKASLQQAMTIPEDSEGHSMQDMSPQKRIRLKFRQMRKSKRVADLLGRGRESLARQMEAEALAHSKDLNNRLSGRYSVWRREYENQKPDNTLKLMKDQILMAKLYASIAHSKNEPYLYKSLSKHIKDSRDTIGEATSDAELKPGSLEQAKKMGSILLTAKDRLYSCSVVARKLRAMLQYQEGNVVAVKRRSTFLIQLAAKTFPKSLHCLSLLLTTEYFSHGYTAKEMPNAGKLEDRSLYHYAIFSDNVLATSVVVNSTTSHAKDPEKHVFHVVTDGLNFAAMRMWFIANAPPRVTVNVENIDDFKWLNSSYCSVLRQLESSRIKEYYFKSDNPSSLSEGHENLKYRNPKYLSMLNHLRFYLPEVYPKLDKILFLDDDVVVQKDLTPLWSVDMKGMVNGAVETCKESFHRLNTYLNFSNPLISKSFDPKACGWAFGMNMFDLKAWRRKNITGIYHYWQDQNEDRALWKLGSLPPGLITFYNLTYPLDRGWHVLGLGYDSGVEIKEIEGAAVIHYNGNYKPWLDLGIVRFRKYWSRFVDPHNPYIRTCRASFD